MNPHEIAIHLVVVNYNTSLKVARLLRSLELEMLDTIVVVDNSCDTGERDRLARFVESSTLGAPHLAVQIVTSEDNAGFGAGCNSAAARIAARDGDYLLFLNPDTVARPEFLRHLRQGIAETSADMIAPLVVSGFNEDRLWYLGGSLQTNSALSIHWRIGSRVTDDLIAQAIRRHVTFVTGAAFLIRYESWLKLGGFREDLFLYWEDADLSYRAGRLGASIALWPQAVIWHECNGASGGSGLSATYQYYVQRNRIVLWKEWNRARPWTSPRIWLGSLRLSVLAIVRERADRKRKLAASILGLVAGMHGQTGRVTNRKWY